MAFRDLQDLANASLFSAPGFGETVVYTPAGGSPVEIQGVYFKRELEVDLGESTVSSVEHRVDVRVADISGGPRRGATATVRTVVYDVRDVQGPDDSGVSKLMLELPD